MRRSFVAAGVFVVISCMAVPAQTPTNSGNPIIGTWKLNLENSRFEPGPPPKSEVRRYEDRGGGLIRATVVGVDAQGNPTFSQSTAQYNGKEVPLVTNAQTAASMSYKTIDPYTVEITQKEGGKVVATLIRTISKDGKTLTLASKGTDAQGQPFNNVRVFDRQFF